MKQMNGEHALSFSDGMYYSLLRAGLLTPRALRPMPAIDPTEQLGTLCDLLAFLGVLASLALSLCLLCSLS